MSEVVQNGLTGLYKQLGNLTVVGFLCVAFWAMQRDYVQMARDDRAAFREISDRTLKTTENAMRDLRSDFDRLARAVEKLAEDKR